MKEPEIDHLASGREWTFEARIIAALVNRLGGSVILSELELDFDYKKDGMIMTPVDSSAMAIEVQRST